jgi:hypothetical protein
MSPLPRGFDHADDSLATRMHVDVLHRDFLLALAAMAIERFEEGGVRSHLFHGSVFGVAVRKV